MTAPRGRARLRRAGRRLALSAVALIAVWLLFDHVAADAIHSNRQRHLSGSFQAPKPTVRPGDAVAVLQIPALGVNQVVVEGATVNHLRGGPVRVTDGALPGAPGSMVVLGHRHGYGAPFERLDEMVPGDQVVVQARNGPIVRYVVSNVLRDAQLADLPLVDDGQSHLVLVTSEGDRLSGAQLVVVADSPPVTDDPTKRPDLRSAAFERQPLGIDTALFNIAAIGAALCWVFLRSRVGTVTAACLTAPVAVAAALWLMLMLDAVRPLTR